MVATGFELFEYKIPDYGHLISFTTTGNVECTMTVYYVVDKWCENPQSNRSHFLEMI